MQSEVIIKHNCNIKKATQNLSVIVTLKQNTIP